MEINVSLNINKLTNPKNNIYIFFVKLIPKSNLGFEKWTFINVQNEKAEKSFEKANYEKWI